jgi:hypothetical protein
VAIALICVLGGILLALITNVAVSVFVTSLSFVIYLGSRFVVGPTLLGREQRRRDVGPGGEGATAVP